MQAPHERHLLILGGGTAGWMTACLLATQARTLRLRISLVESSDIGIIGVGEGSTPYMRHFFEQLGMAEADWMPQCHASYKCGIRFPNWSTVQGYESYVHPFFNAQDWPLGQQFMAQARMRCRGRDAAANPQDFFLAAELARQSRAPKTAALASGNSMPPMDYAYHFDAGLLGQHLKQWAKSKGVEHQLGTIRQVQRHERGDIAALEMEDGRRLDADLFVDCSGFQGLLCQQTLGARFLPYKDQLLNDRAIAIPTPLSAEQDIPPETTSAALRHGWAWQIPLTQRFGNGYVYASSFVSDDEAEAELRQHLGELAKGQDARRLKMRVGRLDTHWQHNCVAIGLSQGFIEPLEATALMLVQLAIEQFIDALKEADLSPRAQATYNSRINQMFDGVRDYVLGHYVLNTRQDTPYWQACRSIPNLPERLRSILEVWDAGGDFEAELSRHGDALMYQRPSWYCLLAGMGRFPSRIESARSTDLATVSATQARTRLATMAQGFASHRSYLQRMASDPH